MAGNLFGGGQDNKGDEFKDKVDVHSKALITATQRIKDLESTQDLMNEKIELLDHNSIKNFKKLFAEQKELRTQILELKQEINKIKDFKKKVTKQIKLMATGDEISKLEKYIDLWNPMDFVTREELEENQRKTVKQIEEIVMNFISSKKTQDIKKKSQDFKEKSSQKK